MSKKQNPQRSFWDSAGIKIGVISGAIGIILTLISAFSSFKPTKKEKLEIQEKEISLKQYEPRLEVSYLDVAGDIYSMSRHDMKNKKDIFYLDYPAVNNEIKNNSTNIVATESDQAGDGHTVYLMVQNNGKSAATDIEITTRRYNIKKKIVITETVSGANGGYESQIDSSANDNSTITIKIPQTLETGEGILVPILISQGGTSYNGPVLSWSIISKIVYLPQVIRYKSSISEKIIEKPIRKMATPTKIAGGVEIRG